MRLIDIYKEASDGTISLVTAGCIQTGGTLLTRTPKNQFYELADGTCVCYPCATAKAETVLELECTETQAQAIDTVTNRGSMLFAGLRCGANLAEALHPPRTGYRAFLTGQIEIEKMYACANVYRVRIPLRFDVSGTEYRSETLPVICPNLLTISGTTAQVRFFPYRLLDGNPVFVRRNTLFTGESSLTFTLTFFQADSETALTDCSAFIRNSAFTTTVYEPTWGDGSLTVVTPLAAGGQTLDIRIIKSGLHALRLRLPVYRQAVIA